MKITDCAKKISIHEKGKKQADISTICEMFKKLDKILGGALYPIIRLKRK